MTTKREAEADQNTLLPRCGVEADQPEVVDQQVKRPAALTIAHWQRRVFAEMPFSGDQERAERFNEIAREQGWNYSATRYDFARLRMAAAGVQLSSPAQPRSEAGDPLVLLRQLVRQFGKDGVKKLVDSL
jgi:hypothetical protein